MNSISSRIRFIRKSLGLRQIEFSKIIGVSQAGLSDFENGKITPSVETLIAISNYSGVSIDWILKGDFQAEDMYKEKIIVLNTIIDYFYAASKFLQESHKIPRETISTIFEDHLQSMYNTHLSKDEKELLHILSGLYPKQKQEFFNSIKDLLNKYKTNSQSS